MSPYREQAHREKILEPLCVCEGEYVCILQYTKSSWQAVIVFLSALHDE